MQLDLFADSRDVVLRNDVVRALLARDPGQAQQALCLLAAEWPDEPLLPAYAELLLALLSPPALLRSRSEAVAAMETLDRRIAPLATDVLPRSAVHDWLAPLWRALAQAMSALPHAGGETPVHAAVAWLRAGSWPEAEAAVQSIPSWRRIPVPLAWMAEARFAQGNLNAAWPLLAELAWLAPQRFDTLARRLDSPVLTRLLRAFNSVMESESPDDPLCGLVWFPAFAALVEPVHAGALREAQGSGNAAPERGLRLILQILALERQGQHAEVVALRRKLRDLHPGLFERYMQTRS